MKSVRTCQATNCNVRFDAVLLAVGAEQPRDLAIPGRELKGIHYAMDYLTQQNKRGAGDRFASAEEIIAAGKRVIIIGGGDTGADCLGTAHRQKAASVHQLQIHPMPPGDRHHYDALAALAAAAARGSGARRGRRTANGAC